MDAKYILKSYTWVFILAAIFLGFVYPDIGLFIKPHLVPLLMLLMFLSCLSIDIKKIAENLHHMKSNIEVLLIIHLFAPLLSFIFLRTFLSEELYLGLILVTVVPSGISIVFLSQLYGGDTTKALIITTISNVLSPITVPLLVFGFAQTSIKVDPLAMGLTIAKLIILPLIVASLFRKTKIIKTVAKQSTYISIFLLFILIWGIIAPVRDMVLSDLGQSLYLSIIAVGLVLASYFAGYFVGKKKKDKITFGVAASFKNFTLATVLAFSLFTPTIALPAIIYTVIDNLFLVPLQFFSKK